MATLREGRIVRWTMYQDRAEALRAVGLEAWAVSQDSLSRLSYWKATSDRFGWFSGWRRADSCRRCRPAGLTDVRSVARRRPRITGVT